MRVPVLRIRLKGQEQEFVLTDNDLSGPIATPEAYANGEASYAHLFSDGTIRRFGKQIGTKDDIEVLGPGTVDIGDGEGLENMPGIAGLGHPSWRGPCESD